MLPEKSLSYSLNARTQGSGTETIVFAHGYGTEQSIWEKITPFFSDKYRLVLFDWPFSGAVKDHSLYDPAKYQSLEGFAADLVVLLEELGLRDVTFVGHSMSGMIGCLASLNSPHLFKSLVLVAASPRYMNVDDYEGGFSSSDIERLLENIETNYENWIHAFSSAVMDPKDEPSLEKFKGWLQNMGPEIAFSLAKTVFCSDFRDILDKVETPCTIIQSSNDMVVPLSVAHYMEENIKGKVTLELIETTGHFPQLTSHLDFVKVLNRALGYGLNRE